MSVKLLWVPLMILLAPERGWAQAPHNSPGPSSTQTHQERPTRWRVSVRIHPFSRWAHVVGLRDTAVYAAGAELGVVSSYSFFATAAWHLMGTHEPFFETTLGAGYIINDRGSGWHVAVPVQIGYRHVQWPGAREYSSAQNIDIIFAGGRVALTRLWDTFGFEVGVMLNVGLPVRSQPETPYYPTVGEARLWIDGGLFLGGTIAP